MSKKISRYELELRSRSNDPIEAYTAKILLEGAGDSTTEEFEHFYKLNAELYKTERQVVEAIIRELAVDILMSHNANFAKEMLKELAKNTIFKHPDLL